MAMTRIATLILSAVLALALAGCARPINLQADTAGLIGAGGGKKIDRKVALVVPDALKEREVITPGGGGDKVSYYPYRDMQTGMYLALSETFTCVVLANGPGDPKIAQEGATLLLTPELTTTSHSPSLLTWPPTIFGITLELTATTPAQAPVAKVRVQGEGRAEFEEFVKDFSLSAKRAVQDTLAKLVKAIQEAAPQLR